MRQDDVQVPTFPIHPAPWALLSRLDRDALRRGCELAIVLLLGLQAARLAWLLLPPDGLHPRITGTASPLPARPERLAIDAFHPQPTAAASVDASGLRLYAVRPLPDGGSAIIASQDGAQRSYAVGDAIAAGIDLLAVESDHVVIGGGSGRSALRFARLDTDGGRRAAPPATAPATTASQPGPAAATDTGGGGPIDPAQLLAAMGLRPEVVDGRITGYVVFPRGDASVLREAGLQAGDVLLSVNNEALDPERHAALAATLAGAPAISLTFRRDGQVRNATLQGRTP